MPSSFPQPRLIGRRLSSALASLYRANASPNARHATAFRRWLRQFSSKSTRKKRGSQRSVYRRSTRRHPAGRATRSALRIHLVACCRPGQRRSFARCPCRLGPGWIMLGHNVSKEGGCGGSHPDRFRHEHNMRGLRTIARSSSAISDPRAVMSGPVHGRWLAGGVMPFRRR